MSISLLILNYEYPPIGGGAGNATQYIIQELLTLGYHIDLVTTQFGSEPPESTSGNFTIYRVPSKRKRKDKSNPYEMLSYARLAKPFCMNLCKSKTYDAVLPFFSIPSGMVAYTLKKEWGIPYIIMLRGADVPGYAFVFSRFWHSLAKKTTKRIWKAADTIIANSQGLRELALNTAQPLHKSVEYVPNGVDVNTFFPHPNYSLGNPVRFLFVGRYVWEKGLDAIQESLLYLKKNHHPFEFTFIGNGPYMRRLGKFIRRYALTSVTLKGWQSKESLIKAYQTHDVLVIPSLVEGMPNVMLEAMACGLPVIGTDVPGINEIFCDNGYLIPSDSGPALIQAMKELLQEPETILHYRKQSLKRIQDFTWVQVAASLDRHIQALPTSSHHASSIINHN